MEHIHVQGLDLKIDAAIHQICEASNKSSTNSRNVLYVIVLTVIISMISVVNTYDMDISDFLNKKITPDVISREGQLSWIFKPGLMNWSRLRVKHDVDSVKHYQNLLNNAIKDSILRHKGASTGNYKRLLLIAKSALESDAKIDSENTKRIQIPILGNSFDINSLGFISGITFCILLFMLRLTVMRELNNLRIALQAITERYTPHANQGDFFEILDSETDIISRKHLMSCINFTRRQHHYNFLSMNEVYTLPPLQTADYQLDKLARFTIEHIFYFPLIAYLFVIANDMMTVKIGWYISPLSTVALLIQEIVFGILIWLLCQQCTKLKSTVDKSYTEFKNNHYRYT